MRLIYAEPVLCCIKKFLSCGKDLDDTGKVVSAFELGLNSVKEIVETAPTVDAVPVVRCKDCKYWSGYGGYCKHFGSPLGGTVHYPRMEDYCSHVERREENADN